MNIYIGNLNWTASVEDLRNLFSTYGEVSSVNIVNDKFTGRSKGFGFVEMPDAGSAQNAIDNLNGQSFMQRNITVNEARPREERPQRERRSYNDRN
ncbi:MAG: RNA recognition motif domain-containing protein [Bacteroidia bacterium]|jgi:RNA recognition motif-containing protein